MSLIGELKRREVLRGGVVLETIGNPDTGVASMTPENTGVLQWCVR